MMIYILILLVIVFFVFLLDNGKKNLVLFNNKKMKIDSTYFYIIGTVLILISGLRKYTIGIDTYAYKVRFEQIKSLDFRNFLNNIELEYGYNFLEFLLSRITDNFQLLLIIIAIIYVTSVSRIIKKYSANPPISFILFLTLGFYTFGMSSIRQTIAISITLLSFDYIVEKKLFKFISFVLIASFFHTSALIFLPSYWFSKFRVNKKSVATFVVVALVTFLLKDNLRELMMVLFPRNYEVVETGGELFYIFMLLSLMVGFLFKKSLVNSSYFNKYFYFMIVAAIIIFPIAKFNPAILRLYYYYSIYLILYIPNILFAIKDKVIRLIGIYSYIGVSVFIFFSSIIPSSQLGKYLFFWQ